MIATRLSTSPPLSFHINNIVLYLNTHALSSTWLLCRKEYQSQDPRTIQWSLHHILNYSQLYFSQLMRSVPEYTWTAFETTFSSGLRQRSLIRALVRCTVFTIIKQTGLWAQAYLDPCPDMKASLDSSQTYSKSQKLWLKTWLGLESWVTRDFSPKRLDLRLKGNNINLISFKC